MKTIQRFKFPSDAPQQAREMPMEFDLHANIGDWVEFKLMPGYTWKIIQKKFTVLGDNSIEYIDYDTEMVKGPERS